MKTVTTFCLLLWAFSVHAQFESKTKPVPGEGLDLNELPTLQRPAKWPVNLQSTTVAPADWMSKTIRHLQRTDLGDSLQTIRSRETGLPIHIEGRVRYPARQLRSASTTDHAFSWLKHMRVSLGIDKPEEEFRIQQTFSDPLGHEHIKLRQYWKGIEVWGSEIMLHRREGQINLFHGRYRATPRQVATEPAVGEAMAVASAMDHLSSRETVRDFGEKERLLAGEQVQGTRLVIYYPGEQNEPVLSWYTEIAAHPLSRWAYFVDAMTGEVLHRYSLVCTLHPHLGHDHRHEPHETKMPALPDLEALDLLTPSTANAVDLLGVTRTIGTYQIDGGFMLLDGSRPMFDAQNSQIPDEIIGGIATLDARNSTNQDWEAFFITSADNTWDDAAAVSAHYNAGIAYEYYRSTFNRNSINGDGGTIFSIVNIADEDGGGLDNAFWNGRFMFYGNGRDVFDPLAAALDVGAHEMTHGVIQHTANLEYQNESGAINESFADVFAVLVDREDWQLAEDVARRSFFPTGAMRDMSNPNNGGSRLGDPGWQPAHVDEQYRGEQNNGGVHINSGIPNRAFYLFASNVGYERAEQVYYRALTTYLTRNSEFVDLRLAIIQSARDLYSEQEANAAAAAFDAVGIMSPNGDTTPPQEEQPEEVPVNTGQQYIAMVGANGFGLYLSDPNGNLIGGADPLVNEEIISPPSISDDGSVIVFVNGNNQLRYLIIDWVAGQVVENDVLSTENVWRRAAISKDAARIAVVTQEENAQVLIFDFATGQQRVFALFNPTFTQGIVSEEVRYADAMEWDITSQFLIYDAFNEVGGFSGFGGYTFWDIGIMQVWDSNSNGFGDGQIAKFFTQLPQGVAVGNPSVAKNSPNIIAFDYVEQNLLEFAVLGYDLVNNTVQTIFTNNVIGFPNYSVDDRFLLYNSQTQGSDVVAVMPLAEDKISSAGQPQVFMTGAKWPVWFGIGVRDLTTNTEQNRIIAQNQLRVFPNPVLDQMQVSLQVQEQSDLELQLIDPMGRAIRAWREMVPAGEWRKSYPVSDISPGVYFLNVRAGQHWVTQKVVLRN